MDRIRPAPARLTDARLDWDLGNLEAQSTPWALYCVHRAVPDHCLLCVRAHYPAWWPMPSGRIVMTWGSGWVVRVKWHSHDCQHPRFPSRTLNCDEMINVILG